MASVSSIVLCGELTAWTREGFINGGVKITAGRFDKSCNR